MTGLAGIQEQLIERLSSRASLCSLLFKAWADLGTGIAVGAKELTAAAHLSYSEEAGASDVLGTLHDMGLLVGAAPRWRPSRALTEHLATLALVFGAIVNAAVKMTPIVGVKLTPCG